MFDWNDEELTDIIWDEAGEGDSHIVPYPHQVEEKPPILFGDPTKKEIDQETSHVEQKKFSTKSEHGVELDGNSKYDHGDPATGSGHDTWPDELDQPLSDTAKAYKDSMETAASSILTKNSENGSLRDETIQFGNDSDMFHNPPEDREQGDFVDYDWANIGSFDDLDRIFSNNDSIFGDTSVCNADEIWSSSKDVTSSPLSHAPEGVQANIDIIEHCDGKSKLLLREKSFAQCQTFEIDGKCDGTAATHKESPEKGNRQKRLPKGQKLDKKSEARQLHDLSFTWSSSGSPFEQFNSPNAPSMVNPCPPSVLTQQREIQRPGSLVQNHFSPPFMASPLYGNVVNYYPGPPVLAHFHPGDGNEVPPCNANFLKKSVDAAVKPPAMTPKEKIEKLRRRQQMRAILAIQEQQQQQFGNQEATADHSMIDERNVEVDECLSIFPPLGPNSPGENNDSDTISVAYDNCSVEESVLYRLQDVIAKLELQIRLCIRDSLFRLAQSAMQRQYPSDTSSANTRSRDEVLANEDGDNHGRFTRIPDVVETGTNPIDRTVARLLFHRPLESSRKPADKWKNVHGFNG